MANLREEAEVFLGSKEAVLAKLQQLTDLHAAAQPIRIAVAFWGHGAETLVVPEKRYQIICNLLRGGTNPMVIRTLRAMPNVEIRHLSDLHAKVILADGRAIVGSANFSADGLGLGVEERPGWLEAAAVIDIAAVEDWFIARWEASIEVSEDALARADKVWADRVLPQLGEGATDAPTGPEPQLSESDLFKPTITGDNKIRMAARPIETIYFQEIEPESKRSVWIPAYAASLLWTTAGNRIQTKVGDRSYFERPSDVLGRAKHPKTIEKIHRFVSTLAKHPNASPAIRYWADRYLRSMT